MLTLNRVSAHAKPALWRGPSIAAVLSVLFFTVALAASGSLDSTFSGDGKVATHVNVARPAWKDRAAGLAIQPNGKIVVVGFSTDDSTNSDFALTRYNANGSLDSTFSGDGKQITNLGGSDYGRGVAIQSNGKIVVVGTTCGATACDLAVVRYNANGSLDTTFNGTGKKIVDYGGGDNPSSGGVAIQSDGKIVAGGRMWNGSDYDFAVYRFNPNGSLDATFSGDGRQHIGFGAGADEDAGTGSDLVLQSGGKIVLCGGSGGNFALARLNSNGALDPTFSGDGRQTTNFGGDDFCQAMAVQSNGKIVAVGGKHTPGNDYFALARYNANGSLDAAFYGGGRRIINFAGGTEDWAHGVAIQPNGKIVVDGLVDTHVRDFALARLNPNGSLDTTFSGDGKATFDLGGASGRARAIALDGSGRYVLAGWTDTGGLIRFVVARVLP